ncbi:MAG: aminotransferase class V-fold PLP-dependent enzyme [Gammaproteobacteria bacterium]|nr:aminotransferase class V-fold PLP-dependent enzyme [Gammaproteobacteria bacterium]
MKSTHANAPIYLDDAATTRIDPQVAAALSACFAARADYGNAASSHIAGRRAQAAIDTARQQLGLLLNARPQDLIWTSGATESDNLAIIGAARFRAHRGRHLVTMTTEHKAVLESFDALEKEGFEVSRLSPGADGVLALSALEAAIREETQLVSIMHVNNETGVVQDIAAIGALCRSRDVLFHTDAAQSAGKLPVDLAALPVDLLSLTAHKFRGPQGVGALYIADRPGCSVAPLLHGGGQERRLRPGTSALHQIVGMGVAAKLAHDRLAANLRHVTALHERLWNAVKRIPGVTRNGSADAHYAGILNISAAGVEGESLMLALEPLCVASGSACNTQSREPSFVLKALGCTDLEAQSAIRFSFGPETSLGDIDFAGEHYRSAVTKLRAIAPAAAA